MKFLILGVLLFAFHLPAYATQAAIVLRDTPLLTAPSNGSGTLTTLSKDTEVILLQRSGGWYKVESDQQHVGWLRMLSVRFISDAEAQSRSLARLLKETQLIAPASGVATGVRGATDTELADSDHDPEADLKKIKSYVPTDQQLQQFTHEGQLQSQTIIGPEQEVSP